MLGDLKHLVLTRPLAVVDVETTGTSVRDDRIVEVAVLTVHPSGMTDTFVRRVNPGCPIPANATAVHGIRDVDVASAPPFASLATELLAVLDGCDLAGFGIATFDLPILMAEFARAKLQFRVSGKAVIDALAVYRRMEPRDLTAALRFYVGADRADAHTALADAASALAVLDAQVGRYALPSMPAELHAALVEVDVGGVFRRQSDGSVVFGFGKYRGQSLSRVAVDDPGYLRWMLQQGFLDDAQALVRAALAVGRSGTS